MRRSILGFRAGGEEIVLWSPLSPAECARRLAAALDPPWCLLGSRRAIGQVGAGLLRARKRIRYHNAFQTRLRATLAADASGTRIACRFGMHPLATLFLALWVGALALMGLTAMVSGAALLLSRKAPAAAQGAPPPVVAILILAAPLAFGWGLARLARLGRRLARGEQDFLLAFLRETIEAAPVAAPRPAE